MTEREVFKKIEEWISSPARDMPTYVALQEEAVKAFYADHPEVRRLFFLPLHDGLRLEVNLHGESAAYKYYHEELPEPEHSKLKKCLQIMEDLFRRMDEHIR